VGFGDIGRAVGTAALGVGLDVVAITRSGKAASALTQVPIATMAEIDLYLPTADFLVITAPLTEETRGLMNRERLALLRPTAALINMARAGLVDYPALVDRLRKGLLGGAVLDVFDDEPLPAESPYWDVPGLLVMPHITCDAPDYSQRVLDLWFDNFERLLAGEPLLNQVDRERGY
jgi:phosphoglycerate dehydrogenase-like enzyme